MARVNVPSLSASQNRVASTLMSEFMKRGLSKAGAAAMAGNWVQESSLNPADHGGYLAQWGGSRLTGEQAFARSRGNNNASTQADYAMRELQSYPSLLRMLRTTNNAAGAAVAVSNQYERPASWAANNAARSSYAHQIRANTYGGKGQGGGGTAQQMYGPGHSKTNTKKWNTTTTNTKVVQPKVTTTSHPDYLSAGVSTFLNAAGTPITVGSGTASGGLAKVSKSSGNLLKNLQYQESTLPPITHTSIKNGKITVTKNMKGAQKTTKQWVNGKLVNVKVPSGGGTNQQRQAALTLFGDLHRVNGTGYTQANHDAVHETAKQIRARGGTDCSGLISYLLGPNGLGIWSSSYATPDIPNAPGLQKGKGSTVTIWNNRQPGNAGHVFIGVRMKNGQMQYWASEGGGVGTHKLSQSEVNSYLTHGSDGGTYEAYHPKGL